MSPLSGTAAPSAEVLVFERASAPPPHDAARPDPIVRAPRPAAAQRRIGEKFVDLGLASAEQIETALAEQARHPAKPLGQILVDLGFADPAVLGGIVGEPLPEEKGRGRVAVIDPAAVRLLPRDLAQEAQVLPVAATKDMVVLAVGRPADVDILLTLRPYFPAGVRLEPRFWPKDQLARLIAAAYAHDLSVEGALDDLKKRAGHSYAHDDWADPAVRLVNAILLDGLRLGATTIHLTPDGRQVRLGYRVDGAVTQAAGLAQQDWAPVLTRLKRLSALHQSNAAAGEGRFEIRLGERHVHARFAYAPTHAGETAAIELTELRRALVPLDRLGFGDAPRSALVRALARPSGLIVVAGPKGSGRSTTLSALLDRLRAPERTVGVVSARPEIDIPGVPHFVVDKERGHTMPAAIAAAAAHDTEIILVDDLADAESAQAALAAVRAGRRVLASLLATDALGALARLQELGLSPAALCGHVSALVAQRLARKLCPVCKEARMAAREDVRLLGGQRIEGVNLLHPTGCPYCRNTGYKGRLVLAEAVVLDEDLDDMVGAGATRAELAAFAREEKGFRSLFEDAQDRLRLGDLSPAEFRRVVDVSGRG